MNTKNKSIVALLATVILFSIHVILARMMVQNTPPFFVHFLRVLIAAAAFFPFLYASTPWKKPKFRQLLAISWLPSVNLVFFMWGIQYTTASASQIIYAAMPILIIFIGTLFLSQTYSRNKRAGVVLGLIGIIYIVYQSAVEKQQTIVGSLAGNIALLVAVSGWLTFILTSKRLSKYFSPIEISGVTIVVALMIAAPLLFWEYVVLGLKGELTHSLILASVYMGLGGTFLTYILLQYAIKHVSSLTVSLTSYIQPIVTTLLAMAILGEQLTWAFVYGSALVLSGIFLATTFEAYKRFR